MTDLGVGNAAQLTFGGTEYHCVTRFSWSGSVQEAVVQCSSSTGGQTRRAAGPANDQFSFDLALDAGNTAVAIALKRGETGAFEFHPEGDTATYLEFTATNAVILQSSLAGGPGQPNMLSLTIGIDGDLTVQAAV